MVNGPATCSSATPFGSGGIWAAVSSGVAEAAALGLGSAVSVAAGEGVAEGDVQATTRATRAATDSTGAVRTR